MARNAVADRASDGPSSRELARRLTEDAAAAARHGECAEVRELATKVRELDPGAYRDAFVTDRDIARCGPEPAATPAPAPGAPATKGEPLGPVFERKGPMLRGGVALGGVAHLEVSLGWRVNERIAVFGTALAGTALSLTGDDGSYRAYGAGVRAWPFHHLFVEGRIGRATLEYKNYDDPNSATPRTVRDHGMAYLAEIGVDEEIFGGVATGDLHLGYGDMAGLTGIFVGLGVTFY